MTDAIENKVPPAAIKKATNLLTEIVDNIKLEKQVHNVDVPKASDYLKRELSVAKAKLVISHNDVLAAELLDLNKAHGEVVFANLPPETIRLAATPDIESCDESDCHLASALRSMDSYYTQLPQSLRTDVSFARAVLPQFPRLAIPAIHASPENAKELALEAYAYGTNADSVARENLTDAEVKLIDTAAMAPELWQLPKALQADRDVIVAAIEHDRGNYGSLSPAVAADKSICLQALTKSTRPSQMKDYIYENIPESLRNDLDVAKAMVERDLLGYSYRGPMLQQHPELDTLALEKAKDTPPHLYSHLFSQAFGDRPDFFRDRGFIPEIYPLLSPRVHSLFGIHGSDIEKPTNPIYERVAALYESRGAMVKFVKEHTPHEVLAKADVLPLQQKEVYLNDMAKAILLKCERYTGKDFEQHIGTDKLLEAAKLVPNWQAAADRVTADVRATISTPEAAREPVTSVGRTTDGRLLVTAPKSMREFVQAVGADAIMVRGMQEPVLAISAERLAAVGAKAVDPAGRPLNLVPAPVIEAQKAPQHPTRRDNDRDSR